ncbi:MAG: DNA repair protein RecN [Tidjanibacter sp.]|nr:DNA repair protein RecN [Tidjanibacter sp.]
MIQRVTVENYALIRHLDITLGSGLNIITGETGAGKSILLGALGLILGNRADSAALADNVSNCVVEAEFDLSGYGLEAFFEEQELEYDTPCIVRRVITPAGKSRAYVNDLPVQLTTLKELGLRLVDIHSQHRSLLVASEDFRREVVDNFSASHALLSRYAEAYSALQSAERELAKTRAEAERNSADEEWVRYQWEQLSSAALREGELAELEQRQSELANSEEIGERIGGTVEALGAEERGVLAMLKASEQSMRHLARVWSGGDEVAERLRSVQVELKDIEATLSDALDRVDADPNALAAVEERLATIYALLRKHKVESVEELLAIQAEFGRRMELITDLDGVIARLEAEVAAARKVAQSVADELTALRQRGAEALSSGVTEMLGRLGMSGARFLCRVTPDVLRESGADIIEFVFSSSPAGSLLPIEKIASGGEISRVMLCLKAIAARCAKLPTIIFDEIDTGVSGRVADEMGEVITELSASMQVLNITHLPQVASKGDDHFVVYKEVTNDGAESRIRRLTTDERVEEIAKMLSGSVVTDAAREQARQLLG